jgi:hypothetical protein
MARAFLAYENEEDSFALGDFTIENRIDRISLYGSIDLTKDKEGLTKALEIKRIIDAAVDVLKGKNIPERIEVESAKTVPNPF